MFNTRVTAVLIAAIVAIALMAVVGASSCYKYERARLDQKTEICKTALEVNEPLLCAKRAY